MADYTLDELLEDGITMCNLCVYLGRACGLEAVRIANAKAITLLEHFGVVPRRDGPAIDCPACGVQMGTFHDGFRLWRYKCPNGHKRTFTTGTFLQRARLNDLGASRLLNIIYCWLAETKHAFCMDNFNVAPDTTVSWYSYCRDVATKIAWHDFRQIGGPHDIVETGEARLERWETHSLFTGISRTTKQRFGVLVATPNQDTLLPIMEQYIDTDSLVCTGKSHAYKGVVSELFAGHEAVDHSIQFVRPPRNEEPLWAPAGRFSPECLDKQWKGSPPYGLAQPYRIHANTVARSWRDLKKTLKTVNRLDFYGDYIGEWMYRRNILDGCVGAGAQFRRFLRDISRAYPGMGRKPMQADLENCHCHECEPA